ncbi:MAG: RNA polymerase sigma factor [Planctomycetota bacterium]|jgi:RNA polymerase sigma factor (sigma-70 family)
MSSATVKEKSMPISNVDCAGEIFSEHGEFILRVIRYHTRSEDEAEDLFQDFFLSLVCKPIPAGIKNIKGYLYRAIANETVDAARRVGKYRTRIHKYAKNLNYSINKSMPEDALIEDEEINKMLRLIEKQLPPREAQAIALRYMSNWSIKDVAKKMYVKNRTVSRYISAGLNKVRQFLILKQGD